MIAGRSRTSSAVWLRNRLAELRLCEANALEAMQRAFERHGQLTSIVAF
jgi:uncharacterized protein YkuJ